MNDVFIPPFYLKGTFTQTFLASSHIPNWGNNPLLDFAQDVILNPIENIKLQGFYSPQANGQAKGLVMFLHGWEGSVNSAYILRTGRFLYENGYSIFRLNYRDHGDTHYLNPGLFYAVLLDEVFGAVQQVSKYEGSLPFYLAGFSLGGNFALRIARKCVESPIENLVHVFSISPALDPEKSTYAIDKYPILRKYFRKKWLRSLLKKQASFPDLYDFSESQTLETISEITDALIRRYSNYETSADYFHDYSVLGNALADLTVPTTIITAQDDPIIPVEDFYNLKLNAQTNLIIHRYGGHNGFLESLSGRAWYEKKMMEICSAKTL